MENLRNAILLVEDSDEDIFFFKRAFKKSGLEMELLVVQDGKSALSLLSDPTARMRLSLIFLDLKIPFFSGFDVLRWIRAEKFNPPLRVIILSGSSHTSDKALAQELGASEYLVKPITSEMLRERLSVLP